MGLLKFTSDGNLRQLIVDRLSSGEELPKAVVSLTKGWAGVGITKVKSVQSFGPHDLSPTEFGYKTIVWVGRVAINIRNKSKGS
ncbi:hypothetical protein [Ilumatobacter coccineus]|nr:hypothetical protein [Ilumatobacter coccineus]